MTTPRPDGELEPLPQPLSQDQLRQADDAALSAAGDELRTAERAALAAMAPYETRLREIRARQAEIATERRRRERAAYVAQRASVREAAKSGGMPALAAALEAEDVPVDGDRPLQDIPAFLSTGGQVGFGFATRPGSIAFTDGRRQRQARTWGEARAAYADGWEPGTPGIPGVRVHLAGSRVERVVPAADIIVDLGPSKDHASVPI